MEGALARAGRETMVRIVGGSVVVAVLAVSWWELLFLPLGANHDGRINGRFGLVVRNFVEEGLEGSAYLASMAPFSDQPYTHHPPFLNILHVATGSVLGQGEWQLRLIGYAAGLATVAGLLWLAHELRLGGGVSVTAMALVAVTPMFWIYARLGLGVSIMVALLALDRRRARLGGGDRALPAAAAVTAGSSWMGAALVSLVSGLGMANAAHRKAAVRVALVGLGAVTLVMVWAALAGNPGELVDHAARRLRWPGWEESVERYRWFYVTLFPWWFRWSIVPALLAALADRRTRTVGAAVLGALAIWTLVAPEAAFVHDYWTYPLLVAVFLGLAVLLERVSDHFPHKGMKIGGGLMLAVLVVVGLARLGPYREAYFRDPAAAGALLREVGPAPGQSVAWVAAGVDPLPRWVSYYWDLPVAELTGAVEAAPRGDDVVLIRFDRPPPWAETIPDPIAQRGRYALVTAGRLQR